MITDSSVAVVFDNDKKKYWLQTSSNRLNKITKFAVSNTGHNVHTKVCLQNSRYLYSGDKIYNKRTHMVQEFPRKNEENGKSIFSTAVLFTRTL